MDDFSTLGKNLKEIRSKMGLTLSAASDLTGVSKTMLSQIERAESVPTLSVVWKIANGLKIRFETLITDKNNLYTVNNLGNMTPVATDKADVFIYNILPFSPENGFEAFWGKFLPGCDYLSTGHLNGNFEYCFVIGGEIEIVVENDSYSLTQGDFISFDAKKVHRYINHGDTETTAHFILSYN